MEDEQNNQDWQNLTKQERRELRRQEKESEQVRQARARKTKKFFMRFLTLIVVVAAGFGIYFFSKSSGPKGEDFSGAIPVMKDRGHINVGAQPSIAYNSNPPTSGQHYSVPARSGFREEAVADGHLIHSLEHGLVWVSYHPRIGVEAEKLRVIAGSLILVAQRETNDTDIAVAAWGRLDIFNLEDGAIDDGDLQRISDFIKRYSNKAPERIPAGQHGGI